MAASGSEARTILDSARVLIVGDTEWTTVLTTVLRERTNATVDRARTVEGAIDALEAESPDCVVTEYAVDERTGLDLVDRVRDRTSTLPVLLATADGSETVASRATAAGVTDYVVVDDRPEATVDDALDRIERALRAARRSTTRRERARQFDAIFHDTGTATWVLAPDGTLERVNQTARELVDVDVDALVGDPFWTLPWWRATNTDEEVRRTVDGSGYFELAFF